MNRTRLKLITHIQLASPPGILGIDAILKAQEEQEEKEKEEQEEMKKAEAAAAKDMDMDMDTDPPHHAHHHHHHHQHQHHERHPRGSKENNNNNNNNTLQTCSSSPKAATTGGYVPQPFLIHHLIPGTQATPIDMSKYMHHVFAQALDEMALKESILEALDTMAITKDSGEDELPPILEQQLTNMILLWELEPYVETAPERCQVEGALGVVSWQMESVK
ncbi:hypothetical protein BGX34_000741 [Mortierella sp. NVP85]|nr:hypothetical protein BGX34_000741 [Mortierella sp. NVP85]